MSSTGKEQMFFVSIMIALLTIMSIEFLKKIGEWENFCTKAIDNRFFI